MTGLGTVIRHGVGGGFTSRSYQVDPAVTVSTVTVSTASESGAKGGYDEWDPATLVAQSTSTASDSTTSTGPAYGGKAASLVCNCACAFAMAWLDMKSDIAGLITRVCGHRRRDNDGFTHRHAVRLKSLRTSTWRTQEGCWEY